MAKNRPAKKDNNKEKKGKKEKGVGKRMKKEAMIQAIISVFQSSPKEPFNYKQQDHRSREPSAEIAGGRHPV